MTYFSRLEGDTYILLPITLFTISGDMRHSSVLTSTWLKLSTSGIYSATAIVAAAREAGEEIERKCEAALCGDPQR